MQIERDEPDALVVAHHLVVDQRHDVVVEHHLLAVGEILEAAERVVELVVADLVAQRVQLVAERGAAGVLAQHQAVLRPADAFRGHDLVGGGILQHAVLMDAGLVREGVAADDRLVRLHVEAGDGGEQLRHAQQVAWSGCGCCSGIASCRVRIAITISSRLGIAGALADAVDGGFHLARAGADRRQRVGDAQPQVVVVVGGQDHLLDARHALADLR